MSKHQPFQVIGYHSCDMKVGLSILNGQDELKISDNPWDWLGDGIYFWEQNPLRALQYANEVAIRNQKNRDGIKTPFVLGAILQLGNCLNLVESESLGVVEAAYNGLKQLNKDAGKDLPVNNGSIRKLDCAVIKYIHESNNMGGNPPYDSIRSSFLEGGMIYPTSNFAARNHIQICVRTPSLIKGYFLPLPTAEFNPKYSEMLSKPKV